jgi:hypothetical protein
MSNLLRALAVVGAICFCINPAVAQFPPDVLYSSGPTDGLVAVASRPGGGGKIEIEAADDFFLHSGDGFAIINSAKVTGLLTGANPVITGVRVEIYQIFPNGSGAADGRVPTRVNSPSDTAFMSRDSTAGTLTFSTQLIAQSFTAANSVLDGINASPNQMTGGEGAVTGQELSLNINFGAPIGLVATQTPLFPHYFFVPQVEVSGGEFYWLSAPRPLSSLGTPFPTGITDLQSWVRNENLDPNWLRVGTDVIGSGTFNGALELRGISGTPEPGVVALGSAGAVVFGGLLFAKWRARRI